MLLLWRASSDRRDAKDRGESEDDVFVKMPKKRDGCEVLLVGADGQRASKTII